MVGGVTSLAFLLVGDLVVLACVVFLVLGFNRRYAANNRKLVEESLKQTGRAPVLALGIWHFQRGRQSGRNIVLLIFLLMFAGAIKATISVIINLIHGGPALF